LEPVSLKRPLLRTVLLRLLKHQSISLFSACYGMLSCREMFHSSPRSSAKQRDTALRLGRAYVQMASCPLNFSAIIDGRRKQALEHPPTPHK
jgi:hypothetical protein